MFASIEEQIMVNSRGRDFNVEVGKSRLENSCIILGGYNILAGNSPNYRD